jgi:hypothetical protein
VRDRKDEWRKTASVLEGVADELVRPKGEIDISVQVGAGPVFTEVALIVTHLPGDV